MVLCGFLSFCSLLKNDDEFLKSLPIYHTCRTDIYNTSRIDIKNFGKEDNSIEIIENSDSTAYIDFPKWFNNNQGSGFIIKSNKSSIDLKIKCIKDGTLNILLKGVDVRDKKGNKFPVYIDYTSLKINNKEQLKENKLICHDKPLKIEKKVTDGEIINLHIEWKPFSSSSLYEEINGDILKVLSMYCKSRIDIKNSGTDENSIEIIENSDPSAQIQTPTWFNKNGKGIIINSTKLSIDLKIKSIKDGTLNIALRSQDTKDKENNKFPIYIDYTSLKINNKEQLTQNKLIWHDEPFKIRRKVKDNELITIHVEWQPFSSSSLYENKKINDLEEKLEELKNEANQRIEELEEENIKLKRKISLISNSSLREIRKIKKEL